MKKNQLIFCWTFIFSWSVKPRSICYLQWLITSLSLTRHSINCYRQSSTYNTVKVSVYCVFVNILLWQTLILHTRPFSYFQLEFLLFVPVDLCPVTIGAWWHHWEELSSLLTLITCLIRYPELSLLQGNSPSSYLPPAMSGAPSP